MNKTFADRGKNLDDNFPPHKEKILTGICPCLIKNVNRDFKTQQKCLTNQTASSLINKINWF